MPDIVIILCLQRVFFLVILLVSKAISAQYQNYGPVFSDDFKADILIFGNSLMNQVKADGSADTAAMNDSTDMDSLFIIAPERQLNGTEK